MTRRAKYGNRRTEYGGHIFDSQAEAQRYMVLRDMVERGDIRDLRLQPVYVLQEGFRGQAGKWYAPITYRGDFEYTDCESGALVVEDVKSKATMTPVFMLKMKLFIRRYPHIRFVVTGSERGENA
jgi:hypothetical protein